MCHVAHYVRDGVYEFVPVCVSVRNISQKVSMKFCERVQGTRNKRLDFGNDLDSDRLPGIF